MQIKTKTAVMSQRVLKQTIPLGIGGICIWLLLDRLTGMSFADISIELGQITVWKWLAAMVATLVSFWAIGRYDVVAHRHLRTGIPSDAARTGGMAAIALSQTLGMGLVTGAFARWRYLSDLSPAQSLRLSAFVSVSFIAGWAFVTSLACLILPTPPGTTLIAAFGFITLSFLAASAFFKPVLKVMRFHVELPSLLSFGAISFWAFVDMAAAATALHLLMPSGLGISWFDLFPLFLIALGAALLSGTPGGVGPFELVLLALLPTVPEASLLSAIIGFRLVYYAVPAVIGLIVLARPRQAKDDSTALSPVSTKAAVAANRSEVGVVRQNGGHIAGANGTVAALLSTPQSLTILFDPLWGNTNDLLRALKKDAIASNRVPFIYKISARHAVQVRQSGWHVTQVASEAMIAPGNFTLEGSARRQLRRKLKQADKASVSFIQAGGDLPIDDMARISAQWEDRNGGAKGTTIGRFDPVYVASQQVFLAYQDDCLVAFATFHHSTKDWCLDLVRTADQTPDGTMHGLVVEAIKAARVRAVPNISLAAVPVVPEFRSKTLGKAVHFALARAGYGGLSQFKNSFGPTWQPRYAAAPDKASLTLAAADLTRMVHRPA